MKIKAKLTISRPMGQDFDEEVISIVLQDESSRVEFFDGKIAISDLMRALTGQASMPVIADVRGLDKVGKLKERKPLLIPIPKEIAWTERKKYAEENAQRLCDAGWIAVLYFDSQSSFLKRDGESYANTHQIRFVSKNEGGD